MTKLIEVFCEINVRARSNFEHSEYTQFPPTSVFLSECLQMAFIDIFKRELSNSTIKNNFGLTLYSYSRSLLSMTNYSIGNFRSLERNQSSSREETHKSNDNGGNNIKSNRISDDNGTTCISSLISSGNKYLHLIEQMIRSYCQSKRKRGDNRDSDALFELQRQQQRQRQLQFQDDRSQQQALHYRQLEQQKQRPFSYPYNYNYPFSLQSFNPHSSFHFQNAQPLTVGGQNAEGSRLLNASRNSNDYLIRPKIRRNTVTRRQKKHQSKFLLTIEVSN